MGGMTLDGGRIGPNAVTRLAEALGGVFGPAMLREVFHEAGQDAHLATPPGGMVPEGDVIALHRALRHRLGEPRAARISWEAGRLTAEYLLAHRIPRPVQWLLRILPPWPAARILLRAISGHAWTFAGSGRFRVLPGRPLRLEIAGGPIARAGHTHDVSCDYYTATFETLFRALVSPYARAEETHCGSCGAPACIFEIRW
jgi:divinyl protochlorophyllide a 8-vinyl-reductase